MGIGIRGNHLRRTILFQPGLEIEEQYYLMTGEVPTQNYEFFVIMPGKNPKVNLTPYVSLDKYLVENVPPNTVIPFTVKLNLPQTLSTPGFYEVWAGGKETLSSGRGQQISVMAQAVVVFTVIVPYPVPFAHATFGVKNTNVNDVAEMYFEVQNLGKGNLFVSGSVDVYGANGKWLEKLRMGSTNIPFAQSQTLRNQFSTQGLSPGAYSAEAQLVWHQGNESNFSATFMVGTLSADILSLSQRAVAGEITKIAVVVKSGWNNVIRNVNAKVTLLKDDRPVASTETFSRPIDPWQTQTLEGYLDANGLEPGTYDAKVDVNVDGVYTSKTFQITLDAPAPKAPDQSGPILTQPLIPRSLLYGLIAVLILLALLLALHIFWPRKPPATSSTKQPPSQKPA